MTRRNPYVHAFARIFNVPLLIQPSALLAMLPGIEAVLRGGEVRSNETNDGAYTTASPDPLINEPETSRIAIIPVMGPLVNRGRFDMAECVSLVGYDDIRAAVADTEADPNVIARVLLLDTPGGEVAGCFDTVAVVAASAKRKPIHCMIAECACSAGFALASACTSRSIAQTAVAGSIGVYTRHVSMEAYLKNEGYKVTEFFAGDHKTDGTPFKNLPDDVAGRIQARIDTIYGLFVGLVAQNLGMSEKAVRDTKADIFMGVEAVERGLADRVETFDQLIARLTDHYDQTLFLPTAGGASAGDFAEQPSEDNSMALSLALCAALGVPADASEDQAVAAAHQLKESGAVAERQRVFSILTLPAASGNEATAIALAEVPAMTPAAAEKVLAVLPKQIIGEVGHINEPTGFGSSDFAKMMARMGNPELGAELGEADPEAAARKAEADGWALAYTRQEIR